MPRDARLFASALQKASPPPILAPTFIGHVCDKDLRTGTYFNNKMVPYCSENVTHLRGVDPVCSFVL